MNVGLAAAFEAGAAFCLVINADTIIDPEALSELVRVAGADPTIGLVTGKVYWYSRPDVLQTAGRHSDPMLLQGPHVGSGEVDRGQWDEVRDYDYVDDVYLLVRREVFEQVGGYSPLFPVYWGISDLCARVRRAGWRIVYAPGSKVWHKGVIGNEDVVLSANRIYYLQAQQVPFMWRNATPQQWRAYVWRTAVSLPRQVLRYVKHGDFAELWAHLRGLGSGVAWLARNRRRPSRGSRA
jgi:GT2 family glycosyltransferase